MDMTRAFDFCPMRRVGLKERIPSHDNGDKMARVPIVQILGAPSTDSLGFQHH